MVSLSNLSMGVVRGGDGGRESLKRDRAGAYAPPGKSIRPPPSATRRPQRPAEGAAAYRPRCRMTTMIERHVASVPTTHHLYQRDARRLDFIPDKSVQLIVTSPPYWTLKEYRRHRDQLGYIANYEHFVTELDKVWQHCLRVLVPGGRLVCVVGDVCLSRRKNSGRHTVVPLHASIQQHCRAIGFDNLAPIIWYKMGSDDNL